MELLQQHFGLNQGFFDQAFALAHRPSQTPATVRGIVDWAHVQPGQQPSLVLATFPGNAPHALRNGSEPTATSVNHGSTLALFTLRVGHTLQTPMVGWGDRLSTQPR